MSCLPKRAVVMLLAHQLGADALLLTDVDAVHLDWGNKHARPVHETISSVFQFRRLRIYFDCGGGKPCVGKVEGGGPTGVPPRAISRLRRAASTAASSPFWRSK